MNLQPPIAELTYEDKGPIVIVFTYILISTTLLFILIKLATTATLKRQFDWDDVFISVAALLGIAQSVLTERSAINGVGSFQDRLSPQDLDAYFQVCNDAVPIISSDCDSTPLQAIYFPLLFKHLQSCQH